MVVLKDWQWELYLVRSMVDLKGPLWELQRVDQ